MATTVEELLMVYEAKADQALNAMKNMEKRQKGLSAQIGKMGAKYEKTGKKINRSVKKMGSGLDGLAVGFAAVGAAMTLVTKFGVGAAASFETQQVAFGTLLGSMKEGKKLFEELKQFSAVTPLQLGDITKNAQALLAFGVGVEDVQTKLRQIGDVAQGNAEKLGRLTNAYGKLRAKGKATMEEINRFTENGVPLIDELAKNMGKSTAEIIKMVSQGKIGFKEVDAALLSLTGKGGKFHGMMEKISQTTEGKVSTAMDNLKLAAATLFEPALPGIKKFLDGITNVAKKVTENGGEIQAFFQQFPQIAGEALKLVAVLILKTFKPSNFLKVFTALPKIFLLSFVNMLKRFPRIFVLAFEAVQSIVRNLGDRIGQIFSVVWVSIKNEFIDILGAIPFIGKEIAKGLTKEAVPEFEGLADAWKKTSDEIGQKGLEMANELGGSFKDTIDDAIVIGGELMAIYEDDVNKFLEKVGEMVETQKEKNKEALQDGIDAGTEGAGEGVEKVKSFFEVLGDLIIENQKLIESSLTSMSKVFGDTIVKTGGNAWAAFAEAGKTAIATILEGFGKQFAVQAAGALASGDFLGFAGFTAASAAAFTGAAFVKSLASGGRFTATEPQVIKVGDNTNTREIVQVTPTGGGGQQEQDPVIMNQIILDSQVLFRVMTKGFRDKLMTVDSGAIV